MYNLNKSHGFTYKGHMMSHEIDYIVLIYCLIDDISKSNNHRDDPQCQITDAEICTIAIVAMIDFGGNFEKSRNHLKKYNYIPNMIGKSRFTRRLYRAIPLLWLCFNFLSRVWKSENSDSIYVIDSFPVPVCHNIRIKNCKIYQEEGFRGYTASKRQYFYGLKVHLMVTGHGDVVEMFMTPGSIADATALKMYTFDLPPNSIIYADKAYNNYEIEDLLKELEDIYLLPVRKHNLKRQFNGAVRYLQNLHRKAVETANSMITKLFPKKIHAVTAQGFELKTFLFVLTKSFITYCEVFSAS